MTVSWFSTATNIVFFPGAAVAAIAAYWLVKLFVYPTFFPHVIRYPWPTSLHQNSNNNSKTKTTTTATTVVLAGSFNPPHYGHLAMLQYLSQQYDQVIAIVGMNPNKKYAVTPRERAHLIEKMLLANVNNNNNNDSNSNNVQVEIVSDYIWRHLKRTRPARQYRKMVFCRGIRTWAKDGRDEQYLQFQNTWGPLVLGPLVWPLPTIFLEGKPEYNHVSSTLIRNVCSSPSKNKNNATTTTTTTAAEDLRQLVPLSIAEDVARLYSR
jgi:cytidyltransferase-like protein